MLTVIFRARLIAYDTSSEAFRKWLAVVSPLSKINAAKNNNNVVPGISATSIHEERLPR